MATGYVVITTTQLLLKRTALELKSTLWSTVSTANVLRGFRGFNASKEWKKMGFSKGTLHYMKQNAKSDKPFTLNAQVRKRLKNI